MLEENNLPFLEHLRPIENAIADGIEVHGLERVMKDGKEYVVICKEAVDLEPISITGAVA